MKKYSLIIVVFCSMARGAFAGEFEPAQVPANSQWYLHFDVDGFKKGPLGKFALEQASKEAEKIDALALLMQFDPRKDLHGITLFGSVTHISAGRIFYARLEWLHEMDHSHALCGIHDFGGG